MKHQTNATGAKPKLELHKEVIAKADYLAVSNLSGRGINAKGKSLTLTNETLTVSSVRTLL
ncbi:hypothetical protein CLV59_101158 [Chitinophaga dinghuensis]|uniref:Uncharacterized protein n=1 Tax=Chitinophaga dinghuensis TaxID=1539050 RepID=A0A327WB71_9BACT|nr:hypothetical protein [Chitinophaga dinghuensis]RAJ87408.1 hypothetical protein CLV59_101158 [Chitinophaga dinghuensis]